MTIPSTNPLSFKVSVCILTYVKLVVVNKVRLFAHLDIILISNIQAILDGLRSRAPILGTECKRKNIDSTFQFTSCSLSPAAPAQTIFFKPFGEQSLPFAVNRKLIGIESVAASMWRI